MRGSKLEIERDECTCTRGCDVSSPPPLVDSPLPLDLRLESSLAVTAVPRVQVRIGHERCWLLEVSAPNEAIGDKLYRGAHPGAATPIPLVPT